MEGTEILQGASGSAERTARARDREGAGVLQGKWRKGKSGVRRTEGARSRLLKTGTEEVACNKSTPASKAAELGREGWWARRKVGSGRSRGAGDPGQ